MHNIEKSKFQKGQYVGYGGGAVWHIRNYGKGNWRATPQGNNKHQVFSCATLRDVSSQLETLNALKAETVKTNPAPRKRAISRPSQITKKAPSKRLVARRKLAAKKPVKGYFPNPVAFTTPGPSRKAHWDLPHLFPQPGGAYMVSFWNDKTKKWVPATLAYSMNEAKKWLDFQGYKKAVLLK